MTIHDTMRLGNESELDSFLKNTSNVDELDQFQQTPLHVACFEGMEKAVRKLLKRKANPAATDSKGWTPLHCAASAGHYGICQLLIASGKADVLAETNEGTTALGYAVKSMAGQPSDTKQQVSLIKSLLSNGQDVNHKNRFMETALHRASFSGSKEAIECLLDCGADVNALNQLRNTFSSHSIFVNFKVVEYHSL